MEELYFVDGYHGGIEGHMPVGAWQDILNAMDIYSDWKISFDIEPQSWSYLKTHEHTVWRSLKELLASNRAEILNASFTQPFCWAINGESNVRQLIRGSQIVKENFPDAVVDTYAVQEPCFTSSLPQILKKLGFARMSLKNSTAWGGYMAKMDGSIVFLHSSDGSCLPAVVRYVCEELYDRCATVASGYDRRGIKTFPGNCAENGIKAPLGMCLQDLGWRAAPFIKENVRYVTYREYFNCFGDTAKGNIIFSQDDVLCALPWGNITLSNILADVRRVENLVLQTEKLLALAEEVTAPQPRLREDIKLAWDKIMLSQHHDAYICAPSQRWSRLVDECTAMARMLLENVIDKAKTLISFSDAGEEAAENEIYLRVCNTTGSSRTGPVEIALGLQNGYRGIRVFDENGAIVPSQFTVQKAHCFGYDENDVLLPSVPDKDRLYDDGTLAAVKLIFAADTSGLGYRTFRAELLKENPPESGRLAKITDNNTVEVETSLYSLVFDLNRGACITRLYDKKRGYDAAGGQPLCYLRGYFVDNGGFLTTLTEKATVDIAENGPYLTRLVFRTSIGGAPVCTSVELVENEPRIGFYVSAEFSSPVKIGYPSTPSEPIRSDSKFASYNERYKLSVVMPLCMSGDFRVFKGAPYDICESFEKDTEFSSWNGIKHSVINPFIDFHDGEHGLGVHCDRVNGYCLKDGVFTLTLAFGHSTGIFWSGGPLSGTASLGYCLLPHRGDVFEGNVSYEFGKAEEPYMVSRLPGSPKKPGFDAFTVKSRALQLISVIKNEDETLVRLFNASCDCVPLDYKNAITGLKGIKTDLRGAALNGAGAGKFEIITLK